MSFRLLSTPSSRQLPNPTPQTLYRAMTSTSTAVPAAYRDTSDWKPRKSTSQASHSPPTLTGYEAASPVSRQSVSPVIEEPTFQVQHVNRPSVRFHRSGSVTVSASSGVLDGLDRASPPRHRVGTGAAAAAGTSSPSLQELAALPIGDYL